jgi:UDP-N-acetylglucosamine diphosphorylase/glucosamine-1-phosphate N-acetyltransferase
MNIIIYEDEGHKNFLPLTLTRPVYGLRCGINTLAEKIARQYPKANVDFSCRYYLPGEKLMKFGKGLFINGRVLADKRLSKEISPKGKDQVFYSGDEIVAIRAVSRNFDEVRKKAKAKKVEVSVIKYPWDLVRENGVQILKDWKSIKNKKRKKPKIDKSVALYNNKEVFIDEGVEIEANAVIDARNGPVYIGKGSIIRPLTYLKGPLTIGPMCRIGGEVGESIFHGYSNKQHYGFIGHSYVGEWVNLGAGTTNSDLKNNYGTVKVLINGKKVDSGEKFVGCFIGDHAKTGIGTLLNTGITVGVGANVLGGAPALKSIPDFSWLDMGNCRLEEFLETAKAVMLRRGRKIRPDEMEMLKKIYRLSVS